MKTQSYKMFGLPADLTSVLLVFLFFGIAIGQDRIAPGNRQISQKPDSTQPKSTPSRESSLLYAYSESALPGSAFAGVVPGLDGKLYGVTYDGGASSSGTIYRFDPATSSVTTIYSFNEAVSGSTPYGELTLDPASGKFYGTTDDGGPEDVGTIFELNGSTVTTLVSSFSGYRSPQGSLVKFGGYFYGSLARSSGAIFRMAPDGTGFTLIHAFTDFSAQPQTLTLGPDGMLYGVTLYGGVLCNPADQTLGCGTVFKLKPVLPGDTNEQFQTIHQFQPSPYSVRKGYPQGKLIYGSDGQLYGTTHHNLFRLGTAPGSTPQFIWTAGGGVSLSGIEGGDGRLYLADYGGGAEGAGRILSLDKDGSNIIVLHDFTFLTGTKSNGPYGKLYRNAAGTVYGTTEYTNVSPFTGTVFSISGTGATTSPPKLKVSGGDILVGTPGQGIIMKSPNGLTCKVISIDNAGAMVLTTVPCP